MPPLKQDGGPSAPVRSCGRTFAMVDPERLCEVAGDSVRSGRSRQRISALPQQAHSFASPGRSLSALRMGAESNEEGGSGRHSR